MAGLEGNLLLGVTSLSVVGDTFRPGSPFSVISGFSNDFSEATDWVSCGADPGGPDSL